MGMRTEKNSVEGQLDIFEAMNRAAEAIDLMVEKDRKKDTKTAHRAKTGTGTKTAKEAERTAKAQTAAQAEAKAAEVIKGASMHASMQKTFLNTETDDFAVVAYIDYNMIYLKDWNAPAVLRKFDNTKEAVDYYMNCLQKVRSAEAAELSDEQEPFADVRYVAENRYIEAE